MWAMEQFLLVVRFIFKFYIFTTRNLRLFLYNFEIFITMEFHIVDLREILLIPLDNSLIKLNLEILRFYYFNNSVANGQVNTE